MGWQKIPEDKPLVPGDIVRLTFNAPGPTFLKATSAAMIEATLANKEGYEMTSIDYMTPGKMIFKFKIVKTNPVLVTVLVITGSIMLIGATVGLMFESAEQFFSTPVGQIGSVFLLVVAVIVLLSVLRKK